MTSYDSAARMRLTTWAIAIRQEVDRAPFERALFAAIDERRTPATR